MAFGALQMSEQEKFFTSNANSMLLERIVPNAKADDECLSASIYKCAGSPGSCRSRTQSTQGSTSGGSEFGDDLSEIYSPLQDSDVSDDEKPISPRSAVGDATSCVYSVMFLLQMGAACCGHTKSVLGYSTETRPAEVAHVPSHRYDGKGSASTSGKPKKGGKPQKKSKKTAPKGETNAAATPEQARARAQTAPSSTSLLVSSSDSWASKQRARAASEDEDVKVIRAARSILNKLTIEKFDSLFQKIATCGIRTEHHIATLMHEIFEKATTQHQFIPMYAELCVRLEKDSHIVSAAQEAGYMHNFRRLLLNECQHAFEQLLEPCEAANVVDEEHQIQRKQRALGNIKLIGELVVQGMLSSDLLIECGNELLKARTTCPEALESLAALMMVVGPKFDSKDWQHHSRFEEMMTQIDELTRDKSTPPRVRFLLCDVLDVRRAGWCTSTNQAAMKAAPMKLDAVREKQVAEEQVAASPKRNNGLQRLAEICRRPSTAKTNDVDASVRTPLALKPKKQQPKKEESKVVAQAPEVPTVEKKVIVQPSAVVSPLASEFDLVAFRRSLNIMLIKLAAEKNVPAAVQHIREQQVPVEFQAGQFVDILSRVVEERRGAVRRCEFAFAAGLVQGEYSPFERAACLSGIALFFEDVYAEMCIEVPRLPAIIKSELLPTMYGVFPIEELNEILPEDLRA